MSPMRLLLTEDKMTLDNLPLETEAVITTVGGEGALRCRFLDMGLIPKTKVVVKKLHRWATRSRSDFVAMS